MISRTPEPPYVTVIFTSVRTAHDPEGYAVAAARMHVLAHVQPGFLGVESARGTDGLGLTVSYWATEAAALAWKQVAEHAEVQRLGRESWYASYRTRVAVVQREYGFEREPRA